MDDKRANQAANEGRRDFLKKSLATGAVLWAAPAVSSLPGGRAWAQTYPPPPPPCSCTASAYGLFVSIPPLGVFQTFGDPTCLANTGTIGVAGTATVAATVVCGEAPDNATPCDAVASIATLDVVVGNPLAPTLELHAVTIQAVASTSCPCASSLSSTIAQLTVNNVNVNVTGACNLDVLGLGLVTVNRQSCDGTLNIVDALDINVPGILTLTAAHAEADGTGCPCAAC